MAPDPHEQTRRRARVGSTGIGEREADHGADIVSAVSVEDWLEAGLACIRSGAYFEAHEELELAWRAAAPEERDFFQGLVHFTVAWYQARRGNRPGCERQLAKAQRRLAGYTPAHRGVDVAAVLAQVTAAQDDVARGDLELPPARI
jgi:predicted metal-dependent hydrolase